MFKLDYYYYFFALKHSIIGFNLVEINPKYESQLVVQASRINTLSKLTFGDSKRFDGLLQDIFPGIDLRDIEYENLRQALHAIYKEHHLLINDMQVRMIYFILFRFSIHKFRFVKHLNYMNNFDNVWVLLLLVHRVLENQFYGKCFNMLCKK